MALYHQLKFPSTFIEYRSVSEWKGVVVISNFDSFKSTALGSCLICLGLNSPLVWAPVTITRFSVARHNPHSSWISLKLMDSCLPTNYDTCKFSIV